ncbi:HAD-IC family P-type ATPase, partial [Rectinema subterraneum]
SPPELIGILALADPIRSDSRAMIADLRALNVKPIMLTGDSLAIAREISVQAGIGPNIISIKELDGMDEGAQARKVAQIDGFAEIFPEDKYRIVKLLQKSGYIVGMTGDGVNDAPALKQAEMGIAVSNAADVAKASASVVLTQEGVGVIVQAIRLSRRTYQRMLTWVINKVTKVVQVLGLLVAGFFLFRNMILSMLDMSLLVFANDFVTMSLATDNAKDAQAPNQWKVKNITLASLAIGLLLAAQGIGGIFIGQDLLRLDFGHMQTFVLLTLIFTSQFRVLIVRERRCFWDSMPGTLLLVSTGSTMAIFFLMGAFGFIIPALGARETALALAYSLVFTAMLDCPKRLFFRLFHVD